MNEMTLPRQPGVDRLIKMVGISLVIHIASVVFLNLNPWPTIIKVRTPAYRVTRKERDEEQSRAIPSAKTSLEMESKLNDYYSLVWAKIKGAWTIPENLLKVTVDLKTIIVLIIERDGKFKNFGLKKIWQCRLGSECHESH